MQEEKKRKVPVTYKGMVIGETWLDDHGNPGSSMQLYDKPETDEVRELLCSDKVIGVSARAYSESGDPADAQYTSFDLMRGATGKKEMYMWMCAEADELQEQKTLFGIGDRLIHEGLVMYVTDVELNECENLFKASCMDDDTSVHVWIGNKELHPPGYAWMPTVEGIQRLYAGKPILEDVRSDPWDVTIAWLEDYMIEEHGKAWKAETLEWYERTETGLLYVDDERKTCDFCDRLKYTASVQTLGGNVMVVCEACLRYWARLIKR